MSNGRKTKLLVAYDGTDHAIHIGRSGPVPPLQSDPLMQGVAFEARSGWHFPASLAVEAMYAGAQRLVGSWDLAPDSTSDILAARDSGDGPLGVGISTDTPDELPQASPGIGTAWMCEAPEGPRNPT